MKKFKSFFYATVVALGVVSFTACSDDDNDGDDNGKPKVELKGTAIQYGTATNVIWTDATLFKNQFYSLVVSLDKSGETLVEKYELYKSKDAKTWTKVNYTVDGKEGIIGGEGARLAVLNDKLIVWGGLRSKGADIYGNAAEMTEGWTGPAPVATFRVFSSTDGVNFTTVAAKLMKGEDEVPAATMSMYAQPYANVLVYNGKLVINGGFMVAYGMMQPGRQLLTSADGETFELVTTVDAQGTTVVLPHFLSQMFELGGWLYVTGGVNNYITASSIQNAVYRTIDLTTWTVQASGEDSPATYQAKIIGTTNKAMLLGGEVQTEGGAALDAKVYTSIDGANFVEATTPEGYTGYRFANAVLKGNYIYVLGGFTTPSTGFYGAPADEDVYSTNAWTIELN